MLRPTKISDTDYCHSITSKTSPSQVVTSQSISEVHCHIQKVDITSFHACFVVSTSGLTVCTDIRG